jgi:hypothetical protein
VFISAASYYLRIVLSEEQTTPSSTGIHRRSDSTIWQGRIRDLRSRCTTLLMLAS